MSTFNMNFFYISLTLASILICLNDAARILGVFPMPAISHQAPFRSITEELARRGHEVTVITPLPAFPKGQAPKNLREIDVHEITYQKWKEQLTDSLPDDIFLQFVSILDYITIFTEVQILTPEVQDLINNKNETFDLLLMEHCSRPAIVFSHLYNVPVIQLSSFGAMVTGHEMVGTPSHPLLYPMVFQRKLFNFTVWEKISSSYTYFYYNYLSYKHEEKENAMIRKLFGDATPTVSELLDNVAMVFLNAHPIWEDNRPVPPNVIYLGGIHQKPEKKLPKDLNDYLDSSKHGVIYFSFGTSVTPSALPQKMVQTFLNVFSELPYDVLWKYDKDELPGKPKNVKIEKWLPQADLLRHPKIKLFITQAGLQSTDEAITAGVPMLAIPMLGDQWYNSQRYVHHKIGMQLDSETITKKNFKDAINTIINDESYRKNIKRLRSVMNDQPQRPLERAVWWTEHVLGHGSGAHLKSPAFNVPWTQYYEIPLISVLLTCLLIAVLTIVYAMYKLWQCVSKYTITSIKIKRT